MAETETDIPMDNSENIMTNDEEVNTLHSNESTKLNLKPPKLFDSPLSLISDYQSLSSLLLDSSTTAQVSQRSRLNVLELRQLNRRLYSVINDCKRKMGELKVVVDGLNSKLLSNKYEKQHLLNEIKACLNTKNIFESIEFDSASWPPEYSNITDPHEQMLFKLHFELNQRRELHASLVSIFRRKEETQNSLLSKKKKLEDLFAGLQQLLKNAKPVIESTGFDLEAFHRNKMVCQSTAVGSTSNNTTNEDSFYGGSSEIDHLSVLYEKLVNFVSDKNEFKLRYFTASTSAATDNDTCNDKEEGEDHEERLQSHSEEDNSDRNRNSAISSAYIHVIMSTDLSESSASNSTIDIFLKMQEDLVLFTLEHELLSFSVSGLENWLNSLFDSTTESTGSGSGWNIFSKVQIGGQFFDFENDPNYLNAFFSNIKSGIEFRSQLQCLLNEYYEPLLEKHLALNFDRNFPNILLLTSTSSISDTNTNTTTTTTTTATNNSAIASLLSAEICHQNNSIIWSGPVEGKESNILKELNFIGEKYRSLVDCLRAQITLLLTKIGTENENNTETMPGYSDHSHSDNNSNSNSDTDNDNVMIQ